jgi:hypothetical protein
LGHDFAPLGTSPGGLHFLTRQPREAPPTDEHGALLMRDRSSRRRFFHKRGLCNAPRRKTEGGGAKFASSVPNNRHNLF